MPFFIFVFRCLSLFRSHSFVLYSSKFFFGLTLQWIFILLCCQNVCDMGVKVPCEWTYFAQSTANTYTNEKSSHTQTHTHSKSSGKGLYHFQASAAALIHTWWTKYWNHRSHSWNELVCDAGQNHIVDPNILHIKCIRRWIKHKSCMCMCVCFFVTSSKNYILFASNLNT